MPFLPIPLEAVRAALVLEDLNQSDVANLLEHPLHGLLGASVEAIVFAPQFNGHKWHHAEIVGRSHVGAPRDLFNVGERVHFLRMSEASME